MTLIGCCNPGINPKIPNGQELVAAGADRALARRPRVTATAAVARAGAACARRGADVLLVASIVGALDGLFRCASLVVRGGGIVRRDGGWPGARRRARRFGVRDIVVSLASHEGEQERRREEGDWRSGASTDTPGRRPHGANAWLTMSTVVPPPRKSEMVRSSRPASPPTSFTRPSVTPPRT